MVRLLFMFVLVPAACAELREGLAGYWNFDGQLKDQVGKADGVAKGGAGFTASRPGFGQALDLRKPGQYVMCRPEAPFDFPRAVAVSCWVRVDSFSASHSGIVMKGQGPSAGPVFRLQSAKDPDHLEFGYGKFGPDVKYELRGKGWHHLVGQYDGDSGRCQVWINGQLALNEVDKRPLGLNNEPLRFGGNVSDKKWFNGDVDEVGIWGRTLTPEEVRSIWFQGKGRTLAEVLNVLDHRFRLQMSGSDTMVGPFRFEEGGTLVLAGESFTLRAASGKGPRRFELVSVRTGTRYGPFVFSSGEPVQIGPMKFLLRKN